MSLIDWEYLPQNTPETPDEYTADQYSEQINSGNITSTPGGNSVTRTFFINHGVIPAFLDDLLGYAYVGNSGDVERILPDKHPLYSNLFAQEASVEGVGLNGTLQYNNSTAKSLVAKVTAVYKSVDFEVMPDDFDEPDELYRFVSRTMKPAGEYFTVNATGMALVSNIGGDGKHKALAQPPSRITGVMELTYVWRFVPPNPASSPYLPPNLTSLKGCMGRIHVGSDNFDPDHFNAPNGTVLFLACEPRLVAPRVTTGGVDNNIFWEIQMSFLYRDQGLVNRGTGPTAINEHAGHQFIWDAGKQWWDLITTDGTNTGGRLYQTADLNTLFSIG